MSINLHHLRLFAAVVQHGGFTKAAAKVGVSQPVVFRWPVRTESRWRQGIGLFLVTRRTRSMIERPGSIAHIERARRGKVATWRRPTEPAASPRAYAA